MNRKNKETLKITIICIIVFIAGYYALNHISNRERPPLGNTTYIIGGCAMMAVSALVLGVVLKKHFFPKKRKKSRHTFLDKDMKTTTRNTVD